MTFDIHQNIFDADGLSHECVAKKHQDELVDLFEQSPEGQALREEGFHGHWTGIMLDLGQSYLGMVGPQKVVDRSPRRLAEQAPYVVSRIYEENSYRRATKSGCQITILPELGVPVKRINRAGKYCQSWE